MPTPAYPRNEPCPCGSGKLYKFCHQKTNEASAEALLGIAHVEYAKSWRGNSEYYRNQNLYTKLAAELLNLGDVVRLIDVGCGRGEGIEALVARLRSGDRLVIGLDENSECLAAAAGRLGQDQKSPSIRRMTCQNHPGRTYDLSYVPNRIPPLYDVCLIQSDILFPDTELNQALDGCGLFDAVTLWFSGTHKARQNAQFIRDREIDNDVIHRERVEDAVLDLAVQRLRPQGWLHVVNRGAHPNKVYLMDSFTEAMTELALGSVMNLRSVTAIAYEEPRKGPRIGVGSREFASEDLPTFAVSAIFQKDF
jgi:hypothetical protein